MIAHINNEGQEQTVEEHLIGTANRARLKGQNLNLANTMYITGLFHDFGKNCTKYEDYLRKAVENPTSVRRGEVDHSTAGGKYIFDKYYDNKQIQKITSQIISIAITSHHGLYDCLNIDGEDIYSRRMKKTEEINYDEVLKNSYDKFLNKLDFDTIFDNSCKELNSIMTIIKDAAKEMKYDNAAFFLLQCLERLILSILVDSDRADTEEFMNGTKIMNEIDDFNIKKFWNQMKINLDLKLGEFNRTDKISTLRNRISEECYNFSKKETGIYCLPIPTGGGKTLSSLRYAIEHARVYNKSHIIYVAPYLSILEQNADEYRKALLANDYILEHHSNIIIDEDDDYYKHYRDTWDSPIILTTMVQFLEILFSSRIQNIRRMNQLTNSVIIIDEIQSMPINSINLFNTMMNFLSKVCNTTIILCSATQPLLAEVNKKILYGSPVNMTGEVDKIFIEFKRTKVINKTKIGGYSLDELSEFVLNTMDSVDNLLIILNTKLAVKSLYSIIQEKINEKIEDIELVQLTTYMCAEHRSDIIKNMKIKLKSKQNKLICISTQLIEAGVDISFQGVIRSLAGLDSIAQAAGRCNRNMEKENGFVYIVNINEEKLSNLKDIKLAQDATLKVLDFINESNIQEFDLLSPEFMNKFYEIYFFKRLSEMDYIVKELNTNIFDMLSINTEGQKAYGEKNGVKSTLQFKQAFKTAGDNFEVVGSKTLGLIVPYKNSMQSIYVIKNSYNIKEIYHELNKMQRYTVNLFINDHMIKKLIARNAIDNSILDGKLIVLREGFYDEKLGVIDDLEDLII